MTCPTCTPWCATTEDQLKVRERNMTAMPGMQPHVCPQCHGVDWVTSREMVKPDEPMMPWPLRWMKPPSWQTMRLVNIGATLVVIGCALVTDNQWIALGQAFIAGVNLASAAHCTSMIRLQANVDDIKQGFNEMVAMNQALIAGKVEMHVEAMMRGEDDSPPTAPKLH